MRVTQRDIKLVRDLALSHVLSRDQLLRLGYFSSVTRANSRLRGLRQIGLVKRIETPFFGQSLFAVGPSAAEIVGARIASILDARAGSPRHLQHSLSVTNVRLELVARGAMGWRFEQQLRANFEWAGQRFEIRPDGLASMPDLLIAVEVDLGHVAPQKFKEKLHGFDAFVASGEALRQWKRDSFHLLTVTTGKRRLKSLQRLTPASPRFEPSFVTFDQLGIPMVGSWS